MADLLISVLAGVRQDGKLSEVEFWQAISFAETDQLIDIAKIAEEVGFAGLGISEHLVTPAKITSKYPYTEDGTISWDPNLPRPEPWALASVLASHTQRLKFVTSVYVLPMHDLFSAAKAVSTAAYLSGNRVILGAGAGWMADEFELTGQDFHTRGRRMDEMLTVLAKLFAGGMVDHHGDFFDFPPVQMSPVPSEPVPVYIGGDSAPALRRAARHDGWVGSGPYQPDDVLALLQQVNHFRHVAGTDDRHFGVIVGLAGPPDLDTFKRLGDAGVTGIANIPWYYQTPTSSIAFKRETLERFAEQFIVPLQ
jgi:probable F420-dependent oxidoreductase